MQAMPGLQGGPARATANERGITRRLNHEEDSSSTHPLQSASMQTFECRQESRYQETMSDSKRPSPSTDAVVALPPATQHTLTTNFSAVSICQMAVNSMLRSHIHQPVERRPPSTQHNPPTSGEQKLRGLNPRCNP